MQPSSNVEIPAGLLQDLRDWANDELAYAVEDTAFMRDLTVLRDRLDAAIRDSN